MPLDLPDDELDARLDTARRLARAAGTTTLQWFGAGKIEVERKADDSPVTVADRQAEELLREQIAREYPDDAILGEEFGEASGRSPYRWIVDPIDGTKSFICGVPLYATLVGIERGGVAVAGVIHLPALDETAYAARGRGAWHEVAGRPLRPARVASLESLADGLFVTSQVDTFFQRGAGAVYRELERRAAITRTWGDAYGYLLVATGRAAVMVDAAMSAWDAAAVVPIVEEAGGRFTDWSGAATFDGGNGIGSNGRVHDEVLSVTASEMG